MRMQEGSKSDVVHEAVVNPLTTACKTFVNSRYGGACIGNMNRQEAINCAGPEGLTHVMIPGVGATGMELNLLAQELKKTGTVNVPPALLGRWGHIGLPNTASPTETGQQVAIHLENIMSETSDRIHLVGFSLGAAVLEEACTKISQAVLDRVIQVDEISALHGVLKIPPGWGPVGNLLLGRDLIQYCGGENPHQRAEAFYALEISTNYHVLGQGGPFTGDGILPAKTQQPLQEKIKSHEHLRVIEHRGHHLDLVSDPTVVKQIVEAMQLNP